MKSACVTALLALVLALTSSALASMWYVDGVNGSDSNSCKSAQSACKTIGHAISLASSGDSILVASATYSESLFIGFNLSITGANAKTTIIDGGKVNRVMSIANTVGVSLSGLTIRNGHARGQGAGISNRGTLTINNSTIRANRAVTYCVPRGCMPGDGGGIYNAGQLTVSNSTVSVNYADGSGSGIFSDYGTSAIINNTTFSKNKYAAISNFGKVTISNSTLAQNTRGIENVGGGGLTLQNTIVADNTAGNCFGPVTSNGYSLSSDGTCNLNSSGDLNNTDPMLGPLQNNGGPTQTMAPPSGSPAIDAGNPNGCTDGNGHLLKTDQRGNPRPDKEDSGGCDIGAYESQSD